MTTGYPDKGVIRIESLAMFERVGYSHRVPLNQINPGLRGFNVMKQARLNRTQSIAVMAIMSAAYAAVTIALGSLSYYGIQFRVADVLLPFPCILGWPMAAALFIGGFVANIFGGLGAIDVVFGSLLNLLAGVLVMNRKTCPHWLLAWLYPTLLIGLGVPAYLQFLVFTPYILLMPGILISTAILCAIGVVIMFAVEKALPQIFLDTKES
jgi:uncharacterized membrane protein